MTSAARLIHKPLKLLKEETKEEDHPKETEGKSSQDTPRNLLPAKEKHPSTHNPPP